MAKFRIQYLSNLFLSHKNPLTFSSILNPVAPYLALLGNIGQENCKVTRNFFKDAEKHYEKIFWIPGALEYSSAPNENPVMWQKKSEEFNKAMNDWGLNKTTFCQKSTFMYTNMPFTIFATPGWQMTMSSQHDLKIFGYDSTNSNYRVMTNVDFVHLYYNELGWIQRMANTNTNDKPVLLLTYSQIEPIIFYHNKNIICHLYGTEIDQKYNVKTGGYEPWIAINSFGHPNFSKEAFLEYIPKEIPKYL